MSSYKNNNKEERKEIHQEKTKSQQLETIKIHKTKSKINKHKDLLVEPTYLRWRNMDKSQDEKGRPIRSNIMVINCK